MFFEYACHLLVREGVDWLILAVVLAWRMISLQLRDSAGLSNEDHRLRLYTHPSGGLGTRAAVVILIVLYKLRRQPSREECAVSRMTKRNGVVMLSVAKHPV